MQHLDEGTIHSWLDGALTADEAARVEAHVKECPQCAAAVAEARGFIAGSSRILTALDNAPRGVIPAVAPKRRIDPFVWRVAATVLVVAAGTLVVVRTRGSNERLMSPPSDTAALLKKATTASEGAATAVPPTTSPVDHTVETAEVSRGPASAFSGGGATRNSIPGAAKGRYEAPREDARLGTGKAAGAAGVTAAAPAPPSAPIFAPSQIAGAVATDAAGPEQLKVVGTARRIGAKVTLYEVAPGDTVTLSESVSVQLQAVVTGAAAAAVSPQAGRKEARPARALTDAARAAADSQSGANVRSSLGALSAPAPAPALGMVSTINTIRWNDAVTGATLTLSGRMSVARLQEIKFRIERERAAATSKKNP